MNTNVAEKVIVCQVQIKVLVLTFKALDGLRIDYLRVNIFYCKPAGVLKYAEMIPFKTPLVQWLSPLEGFLLNNPKYGML